MTNGQKIALRISEVRQRLNEIAGFDGDDLPDEARTEADRLHSESSDLEMRHRAAIVAEDSGEEETTGEGNGLGELESRDPSVGDRRGPALWAWHHGCREEFQEELKLDADQVPLALLQPETRQVEHCTAGQTPAPTDVGAR